MFFTSGILSYNLPGLNVKLLDKPLSRRILDMDMGPITVNSNRHLHTLQNHDAELYRNEEEFQWAHRDFLTYITEIIHSMLTFLIIVFAILLCLCHRKLICVAPMA